MSTKVEIRLAKRDGIRWGSLESETTTDPVLPAATSTPSMLTDAISSMANRKRSETFTRLVFKWNSECTWPALATLPTQAPDGESAGGVRPPAYPSSRPGARNWDRIEKDIEAELAEEKPEGEQALNELFQKIYRDADDDTRRAMNKSFQESGGTVLRYPHWLFFLFKFGQTPYLKTCVPLRTFLAGFSKLLWRSSSTLNPIFCLGTCSSSFSFGLLCLICPLLFIENTLRGS